jgi:hypothetical protein
MKEIVIVVGEIAPPKMPRITYLILRRSTPALIVKLPKACYQSS